MLETLLFPAWVLSAMIWLAGLTIALLVLASDLFAAQAVSRPWSHVIHAGMFMLLAPTFALLQSRVTARRWAGVSVLNSRSEFLRHSLLGTNLVVWFCGCVALLVIARWPQLVRGNWAFDRVPLLDELALALPMIASLLVSWIVIHDAEKTILGHDTETGERRCGLAWLRFRTFGGLVLVPVALVFLTRDLTHLLFPGGMSGLAIGLTFIVLLTCLLCFYPLLVSCSWKTARLPDRELEQSLLRISRQAGLHKEHIRLWDTDATSANAVVVGMLPRLRRVFFSDLLLDKFSNAEIRAIYRHEVGHLVHGHLHMRIALLVVPLLILATISWQAGQSLPDGTWHAAGIPGWVLSWMICAVLLVVYAARVVAPFIRKTEIEADLFAIRSDSGIPCRQRAEEYGRALLKMAAHAPHLYHRSTAGHPCIRDRLELIGRVMESPQLANEFRRRFAIEQRVAAGLLLATMLVVGLAILGR